MSKYSGGGGVNFLSLLAVALIVLKLIGYIDWPWWWVLAPIWATAILCFIAVLIIVVFK